MNNNGMIEYKESFISKIKNFFKNLFGKKEEQNSYSYQENIDEIKQEKIEAEQHELDSNKKQFINNIRVDSNVNNKVVERKNLLKQFEGNEEALNMLSIDRLKKLEKYYADVIKQNDGKIKKLKASV
ncbi:MAG: hypothetical protein J6I85_01800 [Clostridia bacterium]|nr:hypothetical protein [Clostridia bacterium]